MLETEYEYAVTCAYDGKEPHWTKRYQFALDAVRAYETFIDHGFADEFATINLAEPSGKLWTKHLYRGGKVSGK